MYIVKHVYACTYGTSGLVDYNGHPVELNIQMSDILLESQTNVLINAYLFISLTPWIFRRIYLVIGDNVILHFS